MVLGVEMSKWGYCTRLGMWGSSRRLDSGIQHNGFAGYEYSGYGLQRSFRPAKVSGSLLYALRLRFGLPTVLAI